MVQKGCNLGPVAGVSAVAIGGPGASTEWVGGWPQGPSVAATLTHPGTDQRDIPDWKLAMNT